MKVKPKEPNADVVFADGIWKDVCVEFNPNPNFITVYKEPAKSPKYVDVNVASIIRIEHHCSGLELLQPGEEEDGLPF